METFFVCLIIPIFMSSYRTYEEWKLPDLEIGSNGNVGSYRTYEEWKHVTHERIKNAQIRFLPYL